MPYYPPQGGGGGSGIPGGSDSQIQVNSQNAFSGFANLRWIDSSNELNLNSAGRIRKGGVAEVDGTAPAGVTGLVWLDTGSNPILITSGFYMPTFTSVTNLDSTPTGTSANYIAIGSTVNVSGITNVNPTLTATKTVFGMSLPIPSNFTNSGNLAGTSNCGDVAGLSGAINADIANDRANVFFVASDINANDWSYIYTYQVL